MSTFHLLFLCLVCQFLHVEVIANEDSNCEDSQARRRIASAKLNLWSRGAFALDESTLFPTTDNLNVLADILEQQVAAAPLKLGPIRSARRNHIWNHLSSEFNHKNIWARLRGGETTTEKTIEELGIQFGVEFLNAIEQNKKDHEEDCKKSCELFYCAKSESDSPPKESFLNETSIVSYSMGAVPPEDFADKFGFPLDLIKVTHNKPLFSAKEAANVVSTAQKEGIENNQYQSGKYRLGGDWLSNLPNTREWFNKRLEDTLFPLLAHLFPEIISSPSVLRAHSVSLLKYNSSHPRTDVHIDNGILAMTLAMTPQNEYVGGGTFFEHMGLENVLPMDVGHGTFRPGSVRHGGHRVTEGTRYILGAFLLLEDKVEHVRRLKNRGSELRRANDLDGAAKHFEWALAMNPKCTTCLKDWAEILHTQKNFSGAEEKIRKVLTLLENKDSDALFTLGMILSEQGRDDESIKAYQMSLTLNAEDAELCYNLGVKLGAKGDVQEEMRMYARATQIEPKFGGAWLNWGTALAERGELDDAEVMFLKAVQCGSEVAPKALMNLGLLHQTKANMMAQGGDIEGAKSSVIKAVEFINSSKPLLDQLCSTDGDAARYAAMFRPLRLRCHRLLGQIHASLGDMAACEAELRSATDSFPEEVGAWQMLARILEVQGKTEEHKKIIEKVASLGR